MSKRTIPPATQKYTENPTLGFTFNYLFPYFDLNIYTDIIWERNSEYVYFKNEHHNYDAYKKEGKDMFLGLLGINYIYRTDFETNIGLEFYMMISRDGIICIFDFTINQMLRIF